MPSTPDWSLYRSFLAVADTGSLSAAARLLQSTQPTIGRHIAALEAALGDVGLFTRSPSGLAPTEAALALVPHAEAMAQAAEALVRTASGEADAEGGVIRLTASEIVGGEVLPPLLTSFRRKHPDIDIELVLSNRQEDLLRREADIAVRMARPRQGALVARKIGVVPIYFHGHERYLKARGEPKTLEDLEHHDLIGFDRAAPVMDSLKTLPFDVRRELFSLRTDSDLAQLAMLRAGYGLCPCQPAIADSFLKPILMDQFRIDLEVWVAMHEDLKGSRRMRLLFDHLVDGLASYVAASQI
jgi:DNA-binding transcriptional LysR family regulator